MIFQNHTNFYMKNHNFSISCEKNETILGKILGRTFHSHMAWRKLAAKIPKYVANFSANYVHNFHEEI